MGNAALAIDDRDVAREIAALEAHLEDESYDDELLAEAERLLWGAFWPADALGRSPSDVLCGRPRGGMLRLKRCSQNWTKKVHAPASQRAQFSRPLLTDQDFRRSRIVQIVNTLAEDQLCWIRHIFMPEGVARSEYSRRYRALFWQQEAPTLPALDRVVLQRMADLLVLSFGRRLADHRIQKAALHDLFGMSKSNWNARYAPVWRSLQRALALHHKRCLMTVLRRA